MRIGLSPFLSLVAVINVISHHHFSASVGVVAGKHATVRLFDDGQVDGVVREQDFADVAEQDAGWRLVNR